MPSPKYNGLCPGCGFPLHPGTPCRHGGISWSPDYKSESPENINTVLGLPDVKDLIRLGKVNDSLRLENKNLKATIERLVHILAKIMDAGKTILTQDEIVFGQNLIKAQDEKSKNQS